MISVTIAGADKLRATLDRVAALSRDATPVMRSMGNALKSVTEGTFNSVGAQFRPAPWAPKNVAVHAVPWR